MVARQRKRFSIRRYRRRIGAKPFSKEARVSWHFAFLTLALRRILDYFDSATRD